MKYKVHRFDLKMTEDQQALEKFLNSLQARWLPSVPM
jgi:hypothetical protein